MREKPIQEVQLPTYYTKFKQIDLWISHKNIIKIHIFYEGKLYGGLKLILQ
jgi:hypothetical protein